MTAPHFGSTVAALAFNRLAQETFEKHICADAGMLIPIFLTGRPPLSRKTHYPNHAKSVPRPGVGAKT
jgi:hypothetical protein